MCFHSALEMWYIVKKNNEDSLKKETELVT